MVEVDNDILTISIEDFLDSKFGGYFSAIDYDKRNVLTKEKSLEDQTLVLLGLLASPNVDLNIVRNEVEYLKNSFDSDVGGFIEFKESYGLVNELGSAKTTYRTLNALYGLLKAARIFKDQQLISMIVEQFKQLQKMAYDLNTKTYINKLSRDYDQTLDSNEHTLSLAISILLSINLINSNDDDAPYFKNILDRDLHSLIDKIKINHVIIDITDKYGNSLPNSVVDGEVAAITISALVKAHEYQPSIEIALLIKKQLKFLNDHLWDHVSCIPI
ncbi:MAG: hypothetical protein ABF969_05680 [Sporolactobacillus sp.]